MCCYIMTYINYTHDLCHIFMYSILKIKMPENSHWIIENAPGRFKQSAKGEIYRLDFDLTSFYRSRLITSHAEGRYNNRPSRTNRRKSICISHIGFIKLNAPATRIKSIPNIQSA